MFDLSAISDYLEKFTASATLILAVFLDGCEVSPVVSAAVFIGKSFVLCEVVINIKRSVNYHLQRIFISGSSEIYFQ